MLTAENLSSVAIIIHVGGRDIRCWDEIFILNVEFRTPNVEFRTTRLIRRLLWSLFFSPAILLEIGGSFGALEWLSNFSRSSLGLGSDHHSLPDGRQEYSVLDVRYFFECRISNDASY